MKEKDNWTSAAGKVEETHSSLASPRRPLGTACETNAGLFRRQGSEGPRLKQRRGFLGFPSDSYVPEPELKKLATRTCQRVRQQRSQPKPALQPTAGGAARQARLHGRQLASTPTHQQRPRGEPRLPLRRLRQAPECPTEAASEKAELGPPSPLASNSAPLPSPPSSPRPSGEAGFRAKEITRGLERRA